MFFEGRELPSNSSRDNAAKSPREHCGGDVHGKALRLFLFLVPRRQDEQDARCEACLEDTDDCPQRYELSVILDDCHADRRSTLFPH